MSNSLRDQLLNAGVVNKKQANKAKHDKKKKKKSASEVNDKETQQQRINQAKQEKLNRDRELNLKREEEAKLKEISAQIKQLITAHKLKDISGEVAYHFTDGKTIKRLFITQVLQEQLSRGQIAIARLHEGKDNQERYALIPANIALKIQERDTSSILVLNTGKNEDEGEDGNDGNDEDDPYADYPIPDDLMW